MGARAVTIRGLVSISIALIAGCAAPPATRDLPSRIEFAKLRPGTATIPVIDKRTDELRASRAVQGFGTLYRFGDDSLEPRPVALVSARVAETLPPRFRAMPIELTRLDIGLWSNASFPEATVARTGSVTVITVPGWGSEEAAVQIELNVAGNPVTAVERVRIRPGAPLEPALEKAFTAALASIGEKIDAMKYWTPTP